MGVLWGSLGASKTGPTFLWAIFKSTSQQSYSHGSNICPLILVFKELFLHVSVLPTHSIQSTHRSQEKAMAPLEQELKRKLGQPCGS